MRRSSRLPSEDETTNELIRIAREAVNDAYVPYSDYPVGAALRTDDGRVFAGCNIGVANYSNAFHAEEVALGEAIKRGHREFDRLAVTNADRDGLTPCGQCRQSLAEFCGEDFVIVVDCGDSFQEYTLGNLLTRAEYRVGVPADDA